MLMFVMHIFSFYWLLHNIVTFTSVTVLSYSEVLLQKVSSSRILLSNTNREIRIPQSEMYLEPSWTSAMEFFEKIVNSFWLLTIFTKNLHHRCLVGFSIRLYQSLVSNKNGQNILINIYTKTLTWTNYHNNKTKP